MIEIVLAGPPMGKQRVRLSKATGTVYTPARTVAYEGRLAYAAQEAMRGADPLGGPLLVDMLVYVAVPASKPKRMVAEALAGAIRPVKKPDADNFAKMLDALNQVVWIDDSQIVDLRVQKHYSNQPRMVIRVGPINEGLFG